MDSNKKQDARKDRNHDRAEAGDGEERPRPAGAAPQAAHGSAPRCQSNTEGPSSHSIYLSGFPNYLVAGGIDWFEWSALVNWTEKARFEPILLEFHNAKSLCQVERKPYIEIRIPEVGPVRVSRHGLNRGGSRGQHFEYRLYISGMVLGLSPRSIRTKGNKRKQVLPNFFLQQTGRDCLLVGAIAGFEMGLAFIDALGGEVTETKMSRGDLCLDISNLEVSTIMGLVEANQFITRASHLQAHENKISGRTSGLSAGKYPIHLVIYDKLYERIGKSDQLYLQALVDRRWHGNLPEAATRIEFQMSRPWLVQNGIDTPHDFLRLRGKLSEKLTHEWFRITAQPVNRQQKHQSRNATHPLWLAVQKAFESVFGKPEGELSPLCREKVLPIELARQGRGCLANCLLQMGLEFKDYGEFVQQVCRVLLKLFPNSAERNAFMEEVERRRMEFETS